MTLNITMVTAHGIWQSSDNRISDYATGEPIEDDSIKHVSLRCGNGAALLTYAGYGWVPGTRMHVSDWIRGILRGESRNIAQSLYRIRDEANRWFQVRGVALVPHVFSAGVVEQGQLWAVVISNVRQLSENQFGAVREFHLSARNDPPLCLITGSGRDAIPKWRVQQLAKLARSIPRKRKAYHKLLAEISAEAARHPRFGKHVSQRCVTVYMPLAGEPIETERHGWRGGPDKAVPLVFLGIDLTKMQEELMRNFRAMMSGTPEDPEETRRRAHEAGQRSVKPLQ